MDVLCDLVVCEWRWIRHQLCEDERDEDYEDEDYDKDDKDYEDDKDD